MRGWPLAVALLLAGPGAAAQAPAWQNAVSGSTSHNQDAYVLGTVADASGSVYLVGAFSGTVSLGSATLTSAGVQDGFVAKWSPAANDFVWAKQLGGAYDDVATAVALSGSSIYVTGSFRSQAAVFGATTLASAGVEDLFVTKLTDAGSSAAFDWTQRVGGSSSEAGEAIAVSGPNVYVAGYYVDATFGTTTLPVGSPGNMFVAKLADAGPTSAFVWAKAAGSYTSYNSVHALAVSGPNVYLAGFFSGTATFGATTLTSAGSYDAVVAKLVDAGPTADFAWAQRAGGPGEDRARAIGVQGPNVYIAGSFEGSAATFGPTTLASAGRADAFVAKLTDAGSTGSFGWVQQAGGADADYAYGLAVAGPNVCVVGEFASRTAAFGPATLAITSPTAFGTDLFVSKLTDAGATGRFAWTQQAGGPNHTLGHAIALAPGGVVYVGSGVQPPAAFGAWPVGGLTGTTVVALSSLTDATLTATATATGLASLSLFPSPAHGTATVQLPAVPGAAPATLTVLDALGRPVRTLSTPTNARAVLDLTGLAPGLYAVRVQAGGSTATRRLVVE
ncbi:MAG: hypothetical protein JWP58_2521 [Hymenobacter sp.]|nr:hypothetical protein [Hymenobacter sp.]